jgi:hypothetical protein
MFSVTFIASPLLDSDDWKEVQYFNISMQVIDRIDGCAQTIPGLGKNRRTLQRDTTLLYLISYESLIDPSDAMWLSPDG